MKKTPEQLIADREAKLQKAKQALSALKKQVSAQDRKDRDTALFTVGACMLAAIEGDDPELKRAASIVWDRVAVAHAPIITDYRRKCLEKTAFGGRNVAI